MKIRKKYYNRFCKKCGAQLDKNGLCPYCFDESNN